LENWPTSQVRNGWRKAVIPRPPVSYDRPANTGEFSDLEDPQELVA
jgi:hypothetical protein